jgi:hypothetical protein
VELALAVADPEQSGSGPLGYRLHWRPRPVFRDLPVDGGIPHLHELIFAAGDYGATAVCECAGQHGCGHGP